MPIEQWKNDVTGLILPSENYLDLLITNGGPGIANNVCWWLLKINENNSETMVGYGQLPYTYVSRDVNVRGYIKIEPENRFDVKYFVIILYSNSWPRRRKQKKLTYNGFGDLLGATDTKCDEKGFTFPL
ncbi:MAG: hypothetical protein ACYDAO_05700 [Thermoplasmataceae archaeon]